MTIIRVNLSIQLIPDYSCVMSVSHALIQSLVKHLGRIFSQKQSKALDCWLFLLRAPSWLFDWVLYTPLVYDCLFLWNLLVEPFPAIWLCHTFSTYFLAPILHRLISLLQNRNCCKITIITIAIAIFDIANVFKTAPNVWMCLIILLISVRIKCCGIIFKNISIMF